MKTVSLILFQLFILQVFAQKVKIAVKVLDEHGQPLPYTTAVVLHGRTGTMADSHGNLNLILNTGDSLRFTRIGFSEFRYGVTKGGNVTIQLEQTGFQGFGNNLCVGFHNRSFIKGKVIEEKLNEEVYKTSSDLPENKPQMFTKVEINPYMCSKDTATNIFTKRVNASWVKKERVCKFQFFINGDKKADSIKVIESYNNKVDEAIMQALRENFVYYPAIQNGWLVPVLCELKLNIMKSEGKVFISFDKVR